jgi:hypothetical protein
MSATGKSVHHTISVPSLHRAIFSRYAGSDHDSGPSITKGSRRFLKPEASAGYHLNSRLGSVVAWMCSRQPDQPYSICLIKRVRQSLPPFFELFAQRDDFDGALFASVNHVQ